MKVSELLLTAMGTKGIKTATDLHRLSGVSYGTVTRALNDENVGVKSVVELLDFMGYKLKIEVKGND